VALTPALLRLATPWRWTAYGGFALGCVLLGVHRDAQFIYFQF
jgi:hypothetical protein